MNKYAIVNKDDEWSALREGDLVKILPKRKVEQGSSVLRVSKITSEGAQFDVGFYNPEDVTLITNEVADVMLSVL